MKKFTIPLIVLVIALMFLAVVAPVVAGGRPLSTTLSGAAEVPGRGDPDGSGTATLTLNHGQGEVCFELTVSGIAPATAAHIHFAPAGVSPDLLWFLSHHQRAAPPATVCPQIAT